MNRFKKAFTVGMSAALLASLFTVSAASTVLAANTSSGGGTILPGGAASAAGTLTFAEDNTAQPFNQFGNGSITIQLFDSSGASTVQFSTASTPTVTVNSGVGAATAGFATTVLANDSLVVSVSGTDSTKLDSFTVGNLKVKALVTAAVGVVQFRVIVNGVGLSDALVTASGVLAVDLIPPAAASVTLDAGSLGFQQSAVDCVGGAVASGKVTIAAKGVSVAETFSAAAGTAGGTINYAAGAVTVTHPADAVVTQSVCAARFPSFVTVGDAVKVTVPGGAANIQAGVNNQDAGNVTADLGAFDDLLQDGDIITFTINTAGVLFAPNSCLLVGACVTESDNAPKTPVLAGDRKSITYEIDEVGPGDDAGTEGSLFTGGDQVYFDPDYDVALGVASGTAVEVAVTVSRAGVTVTGSPATVAYIGFVLAGSTAAPNVLIGQNDQSTGMITLKESAAESIGFTVPDGYIKVCLASGWGETWSVGRFFWAVVTSGDLKLNVAGLPATQGRMRIDTSNTNCLEIQVYSVSTVASTIEIRNGTSAAPDASGATNGPKINIADWSEPGPVYVDVYADAPDAGSGTQVGDNVVIAVRAYSGTPIVSVSSQLNVVRGGVAQMIGNVIITEGAPNQFEDLDEFQICLVDPSGSFTGAYGWATPVGINQPIVTTNSTVSGLIAFLDASDPDVGGCMDINIDDTSIGGLGVITISNLKIDVKADAALGSVFVRVFDGDDIDCFGEGFFSPCFPDPDLVNQVVSPAKVVELKAAGLTAGSALGVTKAGPFTTTTKIQAVGKYVSWRFSSSATAGKVVEIWVAARNADGSWGAFTKLTSRLADGVGNTFFHWRSSTAQWLSVRAHYPGDSSTAHSWSPARQARWR